MNLVSGRGVGLGAMDALAIAGHHRRNPAGPNED